LSKSIIEKYGCSAIGLDISNNMRALSGVYVGSDNYFAIPPAGYKFFENRVDLVIAVWALQHVRDLEEEVAKIKFMLKDGGKLFVVNERRRFVPSDKGWIDDSADIFMSLQKNFKVDEIEMMDSNIVTDAVAKRTFYGFFTKQND